LWSSQPIAYEHGKFDNNLRLLDPNLIRAVHARYGGHGLTNLMVLATGHKRWEFDHFVHYLHVNLILQNVLSRRIPAELRNRELPENRWLHFFNTTYLQTSLARPLYAAGRHTGSLVYGVSGPRILVSHPFQGISGDIYNMYDNASDLVVALNHRGYHGRFHFLDYMSGLDDKIRGVPRWAIWFSIIAQHSDIVIFVKRFDGGFGSAQLLESQVTPDWVPKTVETVLLSEIQNAETPKIEPGTERLYAAEKRLFTKSEVDQTQREYSGPYIDFWTRGNIPKDRYVHMNDEGTISEYPLNYPLFQ
jgi:hypothetical protein